MSSDCPPQLQLSIPQSTTSFKRSFEQFGVDLDSPVALDAGGSGNNNDRNKRARSATSFSDGSSDTLASSPQSSSDASGSGSRRQRSLQNDWPGQTPLSAPTATRMGTALPTSMSHSSHQPPRLPTPDIQDIEMPDYPLVEDNDSDAFSSPNLPSPPLSQPDDNYRLSLRRFNEFDSEISVLRRSQSRSPTLARSPTLPPTLPPLSIFEEIPSQTTIEFLPDSPDSVGRTSPHTIYPRHGLPDPEAASEFSLDFSGSSFAPSQQHSPIDGPETHHPHLEPAPRSGGPGTSNDIGFTFRERLDSALGGLRSASPLVPGLDEEEEQLSSSSSSSTRPTLPNPPTLPPIITDTENENEMWNDEPLPTPASEGPWNMPPSLPSLEDLRDHGLPSPSLRGLHHWLSMDELPRRQVVTGTSSSSPRSPPDDGPVPISGTRDRVRDPTQHPQSWHGGVTSSNAPGRGGGPRDSWHPPAHQSSGNGRRSPASAAAVRMLDQAMWNSSYSSSLFSGRSRSPPPSSERLSQFLSHSPSFGRPPVHFPFQGGTDMNLDAWLAGDDESAGPSDTGTGLSSSVHLHPWTENDEHHPSHMLAQAQLRSRPAHLGSSNSLMAENASETRRRSERAELLERSTTFATSTSTRIPLMEEGRRSHLPAWDGEWAQPISAPESAQSQAQPERIQPVLHDERAFRQLEPQFPSHDSRYPRPSNSRSFEEMFEAFLGPENDEFRQRTRPQQQQHSYIQSALASFQRDRAPQREYFPRARAPSPSPGPPPAPPQQPRHRRISSWSNSASAPQGGLSSTREAHQVPANDTSSHSRAGAGSFDLQSSGGRVVPPAIYDYHGSSAPLAREEQPRPYLPIPSLPSPDLGGIFDRAAPSAPPGRAQEHTSASIQRNQRAIVADELIRSRDDLISQLGPFRRASATRRRQNSLDYLRGMTSVVDLNRFDHELSDDDDDNDDVVFMGNRPTRFGRNNNERVATGTRARTGSMEAGPHQASFYNRHGRFLPMTALAATLNSQPSTSRTSYAEQIPQSGTSAGNRNNRDNNSSSSSDTEHYDEVPAATRRSTYLNVAPAHRARTPPLDIPIQPTAESRPRFRPTVPSQVPGPQQPQPASNIQPLDPSSFAPGPFRNTLQRLAQDHQRQVMERNNRPAHHSYSSTRSTRNAQPPPLSHAPSIPPLAFEEDNTNFQGRAPPRPDARYEYAQLPPLPRSYVEYPRAPPTFSSRTEPFQRQPPPAPGNGSSAAQNGDLHRYLSRQARMEASRIDDSDGSRPAPPVQSRGDAQGFNNAIEVLRHDGLSPLRSQQLIERYHRERGQPPGNHPPTHPQPQSHSDPSLFRAYSSSRPRLTADAIVRAVSNDYEMGDEDPPPARPPRTAGRTAGSGAESEHDRVTREALAFRGRRARAFRHPILARMGGRPRALGDFVPDDEFDTSYESLLQLAASVGEAKPRSTPSHVISSMETAEYKDWATADSDKRCPICLDDYTPSDPVLKLTNCSHWLHKDCLQQWLGGASTCPVCRKPVHGSSSPRHSGQPPQIQDIQNYWPFGGTWRRGPPPPGPGPSGSGNMAFGPTGTSGVWPRR